MKVDKIYIDMDGVLADFDKGCIDLCGVEPRKQGWEMNPAEDDARWEKIRGVEHFYDKLDIFPGAKDMFDVLYSKYGEDFQILTGIPKPRRGIDSAADDKTSWVRRLLSKDIVINIVYSEEKQRFCTGKDCILIDDYDRNIGQWEAMGGTGVLFTDTESAMDQLKELGVI